MRVAKALVYDPAGNILVLRRSGTHPFQAYHPDLPGGIVEAGESEAQGVAREIGEEAGINLDPRDLTLVATKRQLGHSTKYLYKAVLADVPPVTLSWEHDQHAWLTPAAFKAVCRDGDSFLRFAGEHVGVPAP